MPYKLDSEDDDYAPDDTFTPDDVAHHLTDDDRILFKFRAQFIGRFKWVCPFCGTQNEQMLRPTSWRFRCVGCRRSLGLGFTGYLLPRGAHAVPQDMVIPRGIKEAYPQGDLYRWRSSRPVHRVLRIYEWLERQKEKNGKS